MNKILIIGLLMLIVSSSKLHGQDTVKLIGPGPWNTLNIKPTDTLNSKRKAQLDYHITLYKEKKEIIIRYLGEY